MSDNIPFEIQMEIIKKVSDVKSLIRFRSVSKPWKSFIGSSEFINGYGARHTQPHSRILSYKKDDFDDEAKYIYLVDDDIEAFKVKQQELAPFVVSPLLKQYHVRKVVGECHGLLCLFCNDESYNEKMLVIWNPSIRKSFGIALPSFYSMTQAYTPNQVVFGFGVCPVTSDPTVVKILKTRNKPWHVEVFTSSLGVWNVVPSDNLPCQSIELNSSTQVVIDRFIYWVACEKTFTDDGESTTNHMVVSFDLITKEFKVVDLPDTLTNELDEELLSLFVSKLKGSLVVYGYIVAEGAVHCAVWVMERDSSFRKLFSIGEHVCKILGFTKSGEPVCETVSEIRQITTLDIYDPCSQQIKNLGIFGDYGSFFMGSYKESLLLLDHSDLHIYSDNS